MARYEPRHILKTMEFQGVYRYVDNAGMVLPQNKWAGGGDSNRSLRAGGESMPGDSHNSTDTRLNNPIQVDEGTVMLIPKEWGIGEESHPVRYLFTLLNKKQIVQATKAEYDHGMHPVSVIEPLSMGPGFGALGIMDILAPFQDHISWLVNSHMTNVRYCINNTWVFDPNMVEKEDLVAETTGGKMIRLKQAATGVDVRTVIMQLATDDVTAGHMRDMEMMSRIGMMFVGANENLVGQQDSGGRKTATEVRTTGEAAASRLAAMARLISGQGMADLAQQMVLNNQQFLSPEFYTHIVGPEKAKYAPIEQLYGDF
ncbi:MAG: hypothetical protein HC883_00620 [Bdellovibrionaceae bacterium]|nr:hypothetical protein [Pseudobdellovibrionaceae bacterium]